MSGIQLGFFCSAMARGNRLPEHCKALFPESAKPPIKNKKADRSFETCQLCVKLNRLVADEESRGRRSPYVAQTDIVVILRPSLSQAQIFE